MTLFRADLTELANKYAEMLRLRRPGPHAPDPRAAMARLAAMFPGVLRELDDFPLDVIEARHAALERLHEAEADKDDDRENVENAEGVEPWMVACVTFHRLARGALAAKRWLGGRKSVDAETVAAFAEAAPRLPFPSDALVWKNDLPSLAHPPRGRLSQLIFERAGLEMGRAPNEVRLLVFGPNRRERRCGREVGGLAS